MKKEYGQGVSPAKFKEFMLEFGFSDALNRTKKALQEILVKAREWCEQNKDDENIVDLFSLTEFLLALTEQPTRIIDIMKNEGVLFEINQVGKLGVK